MKKNTVLPIVLIAISLGLAVLGYIILPEQVIIQFSAGASGNTMVPKLVAILISTILGIGGAVGTLLTKDEEKTFGKSTVVSIIGIGLGIITIVVNSFMS